MLHFSDTQEAADQGYVLPSYDINKDRFYFFHKGALYEMQWPPVSEMQECKVGSFLCKTMRYEIAQQYAKIVAISPLATG